MIETAPHQNFPFADLRSFLAALEAKGDLLRLAEPLATRLEVTEFHRRLLLKDGPAALIEKPLLPDGRISPIKMVVNLFGSRRRIALGLGRDANGLRELGQELAFLRQPKPPASLKEAWQMTPLLRKVMAMRPKLLRHGPSQDCVFSGADVDLSQFPIQECWPGEPAPLISWPLVFTQGPNPNDDDCDDVNVGIYRMQVLGKDRTLMRWLKQRGGAQHHARWRQKKREPLPAAVVIGADPALILAAVTPIPDNLSEVKFAGLLRGQAVEMVKAKTIPMLVPAHAEIILEGHVMLDDYGDEGPYGDHTGYYNNVESFPIFKISAITTRHQPLYLSTYTGKPPDEPSVLGEAMNELLIPLLQQQFPEITDFYLPPEGCSYRLAIVSMRKAYAGHAKRVMMGVWSYLRQFLYTKWVIVVDDDIDIRQWSEVIWAITTRADPARDCLIIDNTPIDYLDFASPQSGLGSKLGLDATNKWPGETTREWGKPLFMDETTIQKIDELMARLSL